MGEAKRRGTYAERKAHPKSAPRPQPATHHLYTGPQLLRGLLALTQPKAKLLREKLL
jgi:hypothetical protein